MLPRPITAHTTAEEQITPRQDKATFQYGSQHIEQDLGQRPSVGNDPDIGSASLSQRGEDEERRMIKEVVTDNISRIEQYERSGLAGSPQHAPSLSHVAKSDRVSGDSSSIAALPNELLTHVLAHLSPQDLSAAALVSRRFHELVTTPHAWRSAFARHFPGPDATEGHQPQQHHGQAIVKSERRAFTRLTSKASWRSEYVLRTRLLRSLARGKPTQVLQNTGSSRSRIVSPETTYSTELFSSISHVHAFWGYELNKQSVKLVHGAEDVGLVSASDPLTAKMDKWGRSDPQFFTQFTDHYPGSAQYGLGPGDVVGVPNVMDISQPNGMVYGEGFPGGLTYYRAADEMRGRFLKAESVSDAGSGAPAFAASEQCTTAVWVAKSGTIPSMTDNMIGIVCGQSNGILRAYSLGADSSGRSTRYERGELTASWVLSPGVPIVAIVVDNDYSMKRMAQNRIWAVALNALGELYVLTKFPRRQKNEVVGDTKQSQAQRAQQRSPDIGDDTILAAWRAGRTVHWSLVEPSRRVAKPDLYEQAVHGSYSYSPRSSWVGMCLSHEQVSAETVEIEAFLKKKPKDFNVCYGWDMRRKLHVDFAGDDDHNAGENMLVTSCSLGEGIGPAQILRYTRVRYRESFGTSSPTTPSLTSMATPVSASPSLFGGSRSPDLPQPPSLTIGHDLASSLEQLDGCVTPRPLAEEWRLSSLSLGGLKRVHITACALDESLHAIHTQSEDPLLNVADSSVTSSPSLGPWNSDGRSDVMEVPGQRARFFAIGTNTGCVLVWNIREHIPRSSNAHNTLQPVRTIFTDSPEISSLAMSSLYLVHGGSDGLVQAWDPLASDVSPIRTLHSRFSSRARRQLLQAQASPHGVGMNMYAAAAICIDPDPTILRGAVSLGNKIRYWAYSSSTADQYKSQKRRQRRSEHGNNQGGDKFLGTARVNLKTYIANERLELEREKQQRHRDHELMADRFGTELLGGSEEEMLAYAAMLSQESLAADNLRRGSDTTDLFDSGAGVFTESSELAMTPATSTASPAALPVSDDAFDADTAEAIRQSLSSTPSYEVAIRPARAKHRRSSHLSATSPSALGSSDAVREDDLDFAIQLSLAEHASQAHVEQGDAGKVAYTRKGKEKQQM